MSGEIRATDMTGYNFKVEFIDFSVVPEKTIEGINDGTKILANPVGGQVSFGDKMPLLNTPTTCAQIPVKGKENKRTRQTEETEKTNGEENSLS